MPKSIAERERSYRKRLVSILPVSAAIIAFIFATSDYVPFEEIEKTIGWKGPVKILPNITIIPDDDAFERPERNPVSRTMASMDLDVVDNPDEGEPAVQGRARLEKPNEPVPSEIQNSEIRIYPARREVPYSETYVILRMVRPEYPIRELLEGIEGDVTIEMLVNEEGEVENAWVLAAVGPRSFEQASLAAVKQFLFEPPKEDGKPVPMWIRFLIRFRIFS